MPLQGALDLLRRVVAIEGQTLGECHAMGHQEQPSASGQNAEILHMVQPELFAQLAGEGRRGPVTGNDEAIDLQGQCCHGFE